MASEPADSSLRRVIGYIRVNTEEQQLSVEAQQQALEGWCRRIRWRSPPCIPISP